MTAQDLVGCINPGGAAPHPRSAGHRVGVSRGCGAATAYPPCKAFVHHWDTFKTGSTSAASASASNRSKAMAQEKTARGWDSTTPSCSPTTSGRILYPAARSGHGALQRLAGLRPGGWGRRSCRRLRLRGPPPKCKEGGAQTRIATATAAGIPSSPRASSICTLSSSWRPSRTFKTRIRYPAARSGHGRPPTARRTTTRRLGSTESPAPPSSKNPHLSARRTVRRPV